MLVCCSRKTNGNIVPSTYKKRKGLPTVLEVKEAEDEALSSVWELQILYGQSIMVQKIPYLFTFYFHSYFLM